MSTVPTQLEPLNRSPLLHRFNEDGLNERQLKFVDQYLLTGHGTKSVLAAGYNMSEPAAAIHASRLLRQPKIVRAIKRRLGTSIASPSEVLETLTKQARADLTDVLNASGEFDFKRAKAKRLLKKLKIRERTDKDGCITVEREFEIHDPQTALDKLGRFHKLFTDKMETSQELSDEDVTRILQQVCSAIASKAEERRLSELAGESVGQVGQVVETTAVAADGSGNSNND